MKTQICTALAVLVTTTIIGCNPNDDDDRLVGQLESDRVEITAEVTEPIIERMVTEGQSVSKDQPLIRQHSGKAEALVNEARATLALNQAKLDELVRGPRKELILAAQANVRGARKELEFRETDLKRAEQVYERHLTSPEVRDRALVARDTALANLESVDAKLNELLTGTTVEELRQAEEAVRQAEARLQSARISLDRHTLAAFEDSTVDSLLFEVGERPGLGQPVAILLTGEQVHARIYVPESLRVHIKPGTEAKVYVDGLEQVLQGRVRWVASEATFTPYFALTERDRGRLSFAAKVDILDHDERLPDGVPAQVELLLDTNSE